MAEIRVFHQNRFVCRAVSPEHAGEAISLKDVQAARNARRRELRDQINDLRQTVGEHLAAPRLRLLEGAAALRVPPTTAHRRRLHAYLEDKT
jgi:putative transposase